MSLRKALLGAVLAATLATTGCSVVNPLTAVSQGSTDGGGREWDAGNIFSNEVFYDANYLRDEAGIQAALDKVGSQCVASTCLRSATYPMPGLSNQYCTPIPAQPQPVRYARILDLLAKACGFNPAVAIVMIQKESQGVSKPNPPAALTGFGCPDSGPGGSANCNGAVAGVWQQTVGLFTSAAKGRQNASIINYIEGKTHNILWNVAETGCGSAPVAVQNRATAWIYTYTPYQPNEAALAAYPGEGDRCSAYGNRNLFELFQRTFGPTGGGKAVPGAVDGGSIQAVAHNGVSVTIPNNQFVDPAVRGKVIQAPTEGVAKGLAAGFGALGLPYVWGGSNAAGGGPDNGCGRGGGDLNSTCGPGGEVGFDCSGLTAYVIVQGGYPGPGTNSSAQRSSGQSVPYSQALPGDIVGFPGHVAIIAGIIGGVIYILEASTPGTPIHVVPLRRTDKDPSLHRHWSQSIA